ncbi:carboxylesterase 4A [Halichoerus grypus]
MYPNTRKQSKWLSFREDGLYLTVYRPRAPGDALLRLSIHLPARRPAQPLHRPAQASAFHARVMVWFPGGAFLVGSASTYDASELAAREKVVLVLRQHRLGILAFLRNPNVGKLTYWPQYNKEEKYLWMDFTMRVGVKLKEEKMAFRMRLHHHGGPEKQRHF